MKSYISGTKARLEQLKMIIIHYCSEYVKNMVLKHIFEQKNNEFKKYHVDALNSLCIEEVENNNHKKHIESIGKILSKNPALSIKKIILHIYNS